MKLIRFLVIAIAVGCLGLVAFADCPVVFFSGAETGDFSEWTSTRENNGTVAVSDSGVHRGTKVFEFRPGNGASDIRLVRNFSAGEDLLVEGWVNLDSLSYSNVANLLQLFRQGNATVRLASRLVGNVLQLTLNGNEGGIETNLPIDTIETGSGWMRLRYFTKRLAPPNGFVRVYRDAECIYARDSLGLDSWKADSLRIGLATAAGSTNSGFLRWDDIRIDSSDCGIPCGLFRRPVFSAIGRGNGDKQGEKE